MIPNLLTRHSRLYALFVYLLLFTCGLTFWLAVQPLPTLATNTSENTPLPDVAFSGSPPTTVDDTATIAEDTGATISVLSNDSDPEFETLSLAAIGTAQHGTTLISGNTAVYTPATNFAGTDSFTYTASDGSLTSTARVTVTMTPSNDKPFVGVADVLYDGALGGTPDSQGIFAYAALPSNGASQSADSGVTVLTTTLPAYAGYGSDPAKTPTLNRGRGYVLRFSVQVLVENHTGSDQNSDGLDDRAGFSLTAISNDGRRGIELGFWSNRIWAQNGGTPVANGGALFTQAEGVAFDTTAALIPYELTVLDEAYTLTVSDTVILSGSLRNYTAFTPPPPFADPYEVPNLIFLGDNNALASAKVKLGYVSVVTKANPPGRSVAAGAELALNGLGVMDLDANLQNVVGTMTVQNGVLTLTTTAPGGLTAGQISGNGSATLVMTGTVGQINRSLAFTPAILYRSNEGFYGQDKAILKIDDQGHTGGGAETQQRSFFIFVLAPHGNYLPVIVKKS